MLRPVVSARRTVATGVVAVTVLLPAGPALAQADLLEPIEIDEVCAAAPDRSAFADLAGSTFRAAVTCLESVGIVAGVTASRYEPTSTVTRQQMASLVVRMVDTAATLDAGDALAELPAYDGTNAFADVSPSNPHFEAINRLEAAGIVQGGPGGRPADQYGPGLPVTRGQMATFLANALVALVGFPLDADLDAFDDDEGTVHEPAINVVADLGIGVGIAADRFGPGEGVTRGQMAAFVARTLAVLHVAGAIEPLPPPAPT